jgi:plasmid maintenance system antidote protein VapI
VSHSPGIRRRAARRAIDRAHAQDIVAHDLHVVARMALRLEEVLEAFD